MTPEHDAQTMALAIEADPVVSPLLTALTTDPGFQAGWQSLDVPGFSQQLETATGHLQQYLSYHRRESRLWAIKIGRGGLPAGLEDGLRQSVQPARDHFTSGFAALDACLTRIEQSQFKPLVDTHVAALAKRCTFDTGNIVGRSAAGYFQKVGFSADQVAEFKRQYAPIGCDFIGILAQGDVSNLRPVFQRGVDAQVEVMNYTEQHGLDYIRGAGGPPGWAVAASGILALFGIAISAWAVLAVIAVVAVTLAVLCAVFWNSLPGWARAGCSLLASAGIISLAL
jgi:hypothetical protein